MGLFDGFKKKEGSETLAMTDTERWIAGTYAMWSVYTGGDWHYFAGSGSKNRQEAASMRVMLRRDWEITDRPSLLDMSSWLVSAYIEEEDCTEEELAKGGWDLCRACQILAMGYVGGYIDRKEMAEESVKVGKVMQSLYHSWAELYDSYLKGYKEWRYNQGEGWLKESSEREGLCYRLRLDPEGPCALPWELELE